SAAARSTPSRRVIFVCYPRAASEENACATKILSRLAHLAYRRPVAPQDTQTLMAFFNDGRRDGGSFDAGIQFALERLLVDPDFLLRAPRGAQQSEAICRLSDPALASRLLILL